MGLQNVSQYDAHYAHIRTQLRKGFNCVFPFLYNEGIAFAERNRDIQEAQGPLARLRVSIR